MLRVEYVYWLCGALLAVCALHDVRLRRLASAAFWGILAVIFLGGDAVAAAAAAGNVLPAQCTGLAVVALALIAGSGALKRVPDHGSVRAESNVIRQAQSERIASAERLGNLLFGPALVIPLGTLALSLLQPHLPWPELATMDRAQATLIALGLACIAAVVTALWLTRLNAHHAVGETARLLDALSWAALLPMLLAMLGALFAATGVGEAIAHIVAAAIPTESRIACVLAFAFGMVAFTVIMGNAFAAFPVMMAGIGLPLLIGQHHAHPAALGALGMLTGYCGTLLTPMAANFNIVPAALLELRSPNGVIRAQWPTALTLLAVNLVMIWFFAFS
jgi:uncharacterized membrane protein